MRRTPAALATALTFLVLPAAACAEEYYVPSGNSAVNQYSESFPTAGGEKGSGGGSGQGVKHHKAIGARNVEQLEAQGPAGAATAELAEQTAPAPAPLESSSSSSARDPHHRHAQNGAGQEATKQPPAKHRQTGPASNGSSAQEPASSGFGEVASKAFGISPPGDFGALLPLILLASFAGAVAYRLKIRNRPAG